MEFFITLKVESHGFFMDPKSPLNVDNLGIFCIDSLGLLNVDSYGIFHGSLELFNGEFLRIFFTDPKSL